ncbi:FAD binding domain-containing protein [Ephemerocybe angulata]|uniref:FAD binding domain-containing protein n=1 Tax=Ephemerocybe angulata TaxID=980116 RepID=A0A8H6HNK7_9AGAR|nr:FAD binding domain-containing protein [Tulosesus angulatus]
MADIFTSFSNLIKGEVVTPEHPEYESAIARWAKNAERKARVVVFVKDADDISKSILFAKKNKLPIAIRGGGHNAAGASSSEGGLVIDLSRHLKTVRVDEEEKLAYVGGGALWRHVDEEAIKYGLATVGGTVNHTGVGGLTVGGGYGWLSGRHGLTIDNLKQVTIITANGDILTASATENNDLFWAIRGGGSNFGVVAEFMYKLHPQRKTVFAGPIIFAPTKLEKLVQVTKKWLENIKEDEGMNQICTVIEGKPVIALYIFFNGSEEEGKANFKDFYDLGPFKEGAKEIPYERLNGMLSDKVEHGICYYLSGISQKTPHYESTAEAIKKITEVVQQGTFKAAVLFEFFSLAKVNSVSTEATAFRRQLSHNILCTVRWSASVDGPEKTGEARQITKDVHEIILRGQGNLSASEQQGYTNYGHDLDLPSSLLGHPSLDHNAASSRSQNAFAENYPRLQAIKKIYDPEHIFNKWYPIVPAA